MRSTKDWLLPLGFAIGFVYAAFFTSSAPPRSVLAQPGLGASGPCFNNTRSKFVINNLSSNTLIAAGVANRNIYICEYYIAPVAAAANVELVEGTGATCGTMTVGLQGGATAATGANLSINGGFVQPYTGDDYGSTSVTGNSICIYPSAAVDGIIKYVVF